MPATPQPVGFAAASLEATFPSPVGDTSRPAFPRALTVRVHALGLPLLYEVSSPLLPVAPRPDDHSCRGFFPLRDITVGVYALSGTARSLATSHGSRELPPPASFRPQVFSTSRRFAPPSDSRACFIPQPRPGSSSVQGFLPSHSGARLLAGSSPLAVAARPLVGDPTAMSAPPDFEALFRVTKRSSRCGF